MPNWILDVGLGVFFLIIIIIGYKVGFLRAVIKIASSFGGFVMAVLFTEPLTEKAINLGIFNNLSNKIASNIKASDAYQQYALTDNREAGINEMLSKLGIPEFMSKFFSNAFVEHLNVDEAVEFISNGITKAFATICVFFTLLIFTALVFWILKVIVKKLRDTVKLIKFLDGILGVAFYSIMGLLVVYIFLLISSLIIQSNTNEFTEFMLIQLHLDDSKWGLTKYLYQNNFIGNFIALFF